jgi:hypothetical protein
MSDMLEFSYLALLGSQLEEKLVETRGDVVRQAKTKMGLPAAACLYDLENVEPETIEGATKAAKRKLLGMRI